MKPSGPRQDDGHNQAKLEKQSKSSAKPNADEAANASQNSRQNAATSIQSTVTPEDYPAHERQAQKDAMGPPLDGKD